jgi:hypothetical protein
MLRFLAVTVLCFLAPFILYAGWRQFVPGAGASDAVWNYRVVARLSAIGLALLLLGILALVSFTGGEVGTTYHPAELRDGVLVPGGFR